MHRPVSFGGGGARLREIGLQREGGRWLGLGLAREHAGDNRREREIAEGRQTRYRFGGEGGVIGDEVVQARRNVRAEFRARTGMGNQGAHGCTGRVMSCRSIEHPPDPGRPVDLDQRDEPVLPVGCRDLEGAPPHQHASRRIPVQAEKPDQQRQTRTAA